MLDYIPVVFIITFQSCNQVLTKGFFNTVEPRYNEVLGTIKITLLYQVSHIRVKKQRNIKSWDQKINLVIRAFCYIRPLYNQGSTVLTTNCQDTHPIYI